MTSLTKVEKLKVALILISDGFSGAEKVVWQTIKYLEDQIDFYLITNSELKPFFNTVISEKKTLDIGSLFQHRKSKYSRLFENRFYNAVEWYLFLKSSKVKEFIKKSDIKLIHPHLENSLYLATTSKTTNSKIIYTVHDVISFINNHYKALKQRKKISRYFNKVDNVIFVSSYTKKVYENELNNIPQNTIIYNGVEDSGPPQEIEYNTHTGNINLLFVGGEKTVKGADILLEAIDILVNQKHITNCNVSMLGSYPVNNNTNQLIKKYKLNKYVTVFGFIASPNHLNYFKKADILIVPSRSEAQPLAILEGFNLGIPIIATNVGGIPEILTDGENGLLCNPNCNDLADKIELLLSNQKLRATISKNNFEHSKRFQINTMIENLKRFYTTL
ncbi:glycosyltransferase family 4 protein [Solitalea lacus]|uniref:glycosyltransferase family 4 protein n=1 Tax=Solitalea lacus TaxID=2911172 RepID=UPI001EDA3D32|nr:glycosyltransferase family 4 protein [Solitalea lacus]UKJ07073.1 glycosyltransferase family 4 protein [Solitalea lacus]